MHSIDNLWLFSILVQNYSAQSVFADICIGLMIGTVFTVTIIVILYANFRELEENGGAGEENEVEKKIS